MFRLLIIIPTAFSIFSIGTSLGSTEIGASQNYRIPLGHHVLHWKYWNKAPVQITYTNRPLLNLQTFRQPLRRVQFPTISHLQNRIDEKPQESNYHYEYHRPKGLIDRFNYTMLRIGIGSNGTHGLIGEFNDIINQVGSIVSEMILLNLEFIQKLLEAKADFFQPFLEKVDYKAEKFEEYISFKFGPAYGKFTRNLRQCMLKSFQCHFIPVLSKLCLFHCVFSSLPENTPPFYIFKYFKSGLEIFLQLICSPVDAIFNLNWKFYMTELAPMTLRNLTESMTYSGLNVEDLMRVQFERNFRLMTRNVISAINPIRVYEPINYIFVLFEGIIQAFIKFNPACYILEVKFAPVQFIEIFNYKPTFMDTLFSGVNLLLNLAKGLPGFEMAEQIFKAFDILSGANCGVIGWTGSLTAVCEQRKDILKQMDMDMH